MLRVLLAGLVGAFIGFIVSATLYDRKVRAERKKDGIARMIIRGVHPDDASDAYDQEYTVDVTLASPHFFPTAVTGILTGGAICTLVCAFVLFWTSPKLRTVPPTVGGSNFGDTAN